MPSLHHIRRLETITRESRASGQHPHPHPAPSSVKPYSHIRWRGRGTAPAPPLGRKHPEMIIRTDLETMPSKTRADSSMTNSRPGDILSSVGLSPRSGHQRPLNVFTEHQKSMSSRMSRKKPLNRKTVFFHLDPDTKSGITDRSVEVLWALAMAERRLLTQTSSDLKGRGQPTRHVGSSACRRRTPRILVLSPLTSTMAQGGSGDVPQITRSRDRPPVSPALWPAVRAGTPSIHPPSCSLTRSWAIEKTQNPCLQGAQPRISKKYICVVQRFLGRKCQRRRYLDEGHQGNESCLVSETQPPCSPKTPFKGSQCRRSPLKAKPHLPQPSSRHPPPYPRSHPHSQPKIKAGECRESWLLWVKQQIFEIL